MDVLAAWARLEALIGPPVPGNGILDPVAPGLAPGALDTSSRAGAVRACCGSGACRSLTGDASLPAFRGRGPPASGITGRPLPAAWPGFPGSLHGSRRTGRSNDIACPGDRGP